MKTLITIIFSCSLLLSTQLFADVQDNQDTVQIINSKRADVQAFIAKMVNQHQFNQTKLETLFDNVEVRPEIIRSMKSPYEAKPWYVYRRHFLSKARIDGGVKFWQQHQKTLANMSQQYGIPVPIMVAIVGVETKYGHTRGNYSVLDTLATFAFDYPPRKKFFTRELEQFLLLSREQKWDPRKILGSYAGAVGQPQFMPSSYRAYAVDYDKKGNIDLFDNMNDITASIANYLAKHHWKTGEPIIATPTIVGNDYKKLAKLNGKNQYTLSELLHYGIHVKGKYADGTKASFFVLETSKDTEGYWLGFHNFHVIMRYNTSKLYALAVTQLANAIEQAYNKQHTEQAQQRQKALASNMKMAANPLPSEPLTMMQKKRLPA